MKTVALVFLVFGFVLAFFGIFRGDLDFAAQSATYGNADVSGVESWVMKLKPGIADFASRITYDKVHEEPLKAIGILFVVMFFLSLFKNGMLMMYRGLTQWLAFVTARLGVFRVSGLCPVKRTQLGIFPFLNCQACEMATGACPIGMFQWHLIHKRMPYLVLGTLMATGALLGRSVCGWLCPFGLIGDLLHKINIRKLTPRPQWNYLKFVILLSLVCVLFMTMPFFCEYLCFSGKLLGLLPYYLTTGLSGFKEALSTPGWIVSPLGLSLMMLIVLLAGSLLISGRWFCRYLCPLGAWYGLFNYISPLRVKHDQQKCTDCKLCIKQCPMEVNLGSRSFTDVTNCIGCFHCTTLCKARSIRMVRNEKEVDHVKKQIR